MSEDTFFAPAKRADPAELARQVEFIAHSPIVEGLLETTGGLLAILNEQRQVVAVNQWLLDWLGIDDGAELLGLRHGEVLRCIHANDPPNGCGTTKFCETCGAAIAVVSALATDEPVERYCVLEATRNGHKADLYLSVRGHIMVVEGERFILVYLQDETEAQRRAVLERVFLHDLTNLLFGLSYRAQVVAREGPADDPNVTALTALVEQLTHEVALQRAIVAGSFEDYELSPEHIPVVAVLSDLVKLFGAHPASDGKELVVESLVDGAELLTDKPLLYRVMVNMLTNAFEASADGDEVLLSAELTGDHVILKVSNHQEIPPSVALRVFQRNFTTKDGVGRGLGTFSMKLIGERTLGGHVTFETGPERGTVFALALPRFAGAGKT